MIMIYYDLLPNMSVCCILWPIRLGWLLVRGLYKEVYLLILNVCPFDYTAFAASRKVGIL